MNKSLGAVNNAMGIVHVGKWRVNSADGTSMPPRQHADKGLFRRMVPLMLLLPLLFAVSAGAIVPGDELDQVRQLFGQGKVLHAHMTHELIDSYTGETQVINGVIWISKDKYKIHADHQVVLVNGDISMVYNERQNKLIISEYEPEEDDFAPSRFFSDSEELFRIAGVTRNGEQTEFLLRPDDPFEIFTEVSIRLNADLTPDTIRAIDQMENQLNTTFAEARYLEPSDGIFILEYPENAEIIDLRK